MALDLKKIKERLANMNSKGGKFWRPPDGKSVIRIVPTKDGDPFRDLHIHYGVGEEQGFLCPNRNFNQKCAVCDFASKMWKEAAAANDDASKEIAKGLFASQRYFSPIIVRGEGDPVVKIWSYGKTVYETLVNLALNPEYGDITDTETGTDITLTYGKAPGKKFPQTMIEPKRASSKLCEKFTPDQCKALLNSVPDMDALFERKTPDQVKAALEAYLLGGGDKEEGEEVSKDEIEKGKGTAKGGKKGKQKAEESEEKVEETNEIDAAFEELNK
jgi:hypothetical protein